MVDGQTGIWMITIYTLAYAASIPIMGKRTLTKKYCADFMGAKNCAWMSKKGDVLKEEDLPKKYFSYSMCFRKEIGGHGVDSKGVFRMHQFNKVELVKFCKPEDSFHELE
ncbi:MAG: hypothetical protein HGA54_06920 [Actinobacteria bacterium]|nr:hypothetical protein [Actinomycetota bacterium]